MNHDEFLLFIKEIFVKNRIPFRIIEIPCNNMDWLDQGLRTSLIGMNDFSEQTNTWFLSHPEPGVNHSTDLFQCNYTTLKIPGSQKWLVIGPLLFEEISGQRFDELFSRLKLDESLKEPLQNYYYNLRIIPYQSAYENFLSVIADHIYGSIPYTTVYRDAAALDEWYHNYHYCYKPMEHPKEEIELAETYVKTENEIAYYVSKGCEGRAISHLIKLQSISRSNYLVNEIRNVKNACIELNSLLRKTAEQCGVHPVHVNSCSILHLRQIEQLSSHDQSKNFQRKIVQNYCRLIQEYTLNHYSIPIQRVIIYIKNDLGTDLSLKALAGWLNVNASYLSAKFKAEMGITLTEYVNRCRIEQAQKLLLSTELPVKSIAGQCGIPDIRYFNRIFKHFTSTTPKEYRKNASYDERMKFSQNLRRSSQYIP